MFKRTYLEFLVLVILSTSTLVCANVPKYLPPEMPKPDVCDKIGEKLLESLDKAGEAMQDSISGKLIHFGRRLTGQTCLSERVGLFNIMLDFVVKVVDNPPKYICMSHLFIIEGKIAPNGNLSSRILQVYPGDEDICEYKE